ncbi:hypothetical protein VaNZ11_008621 [Volvox africanus]|uniref:Uncharacterized protein n=1 Tax=Volvox africanus TaxID=51714 RepID=A0ABQ5S6H2_9CHLO|nr:hypothetical protein VaNZ11_008621 [Volvox africanus]
MAIFMQLTAGFVDYLNEANDSSIDDRHFSNAVFTYLRAVDDINSNPKLGVSGLDEGPFADCPICAYVPVQGAAAGRDQGDATVASGSDAGPSAARSGAGLQDGGEGTKTDTGVVAGCCTGAGTSGISLAVWCCQLKSSDYLSRWMQSRSSATTPVVARHPEIYNHILPNSLGLSTRWSPYMLQDVPTSGTHLMATIGVKIRQAKQRRRCLPAIPS